MAATPSSWTLKVSYGEEVRRLKEWPKEGEEASFEALRLSALQLFDLSDEGQSLQSQEEDSEVALSAETLEEALRTNKEALLKIKIVPKEAATGTSTVESEELQATPVANGEVESQAPEAPGCPNWARFKQQVVSDFRSNYQDMQGAVLGSETEATKARQVAGQVAGFTAGLVASCRLLPLHGTRLAAKAVAGAAGASGAEAPEATAETAEAAEVEEPVREVDRFKKQVFQDFELGRSEIQAAFGYFVGQERPTEQTAPDSAAPAAPAAAPSAPSGPAARLGREVLPAVASTVAGLTVASTLVPLRAARLAVASLTAKEGEATGGNPPEPATTSSQ